MNDKAKGQDQSNKTFHISPREKLESLGRLSFSCWVEIKLIKPN